MITIAIQRYFGTHHIWSVKMAKIAFISNVDACVHVDSPFRPFVAIEPRWPWRNLVTSSSLIAAIYVFIRARARLEYGNERWPIHSIHWSRTCSRASGRSAADETANKKKKNGIIFLHNLDCTETPSSEYVRPMAEEMNRCRCYFRHRNNDFYIPCYNVNAPCRCHRFLAFALATTTRLKFADKEQTQKTVVARFVFSFAVPFRNTAKNTANKCVGNREATRSIMTMVPFLIFFSFFFSTHFHFQWIHAQQAHNTAHTLVTLRSAASLNSRTCFYYSFNSIPKYQK